jgi:hypothetical protein
MTINPRKALPYHGMWHFGSWLRSWLVVPALVLLE